MTQSNNVDDFKFPKKGGRGPAKLPDETVPIELSNDYDPLAQMDTS